jgi:peptide/nickel transport system substrate-binding protein
MVENDNSLTRREALAGLGGVATGVSLSGCAGVASGGADAVRYAQVLPPVTLDPVRIDDPWSAQVANRVFQGLYTFGSGTEVVSQLATGSPERRDETTYRVELRPEARFQNGDAVTAADVRYSFEAPLREETPAKWALDPVEEIRTLDEHTVEFSLAHPYPAFTYALTRPIVPKAERRANPESFATDPVGSGPFRVDLFEEGTYAALTAWEDYWGDETPGVRRAKFVGNHSGLARSMSLRSGQNDVVERVQPKLWSVTEGMPNTRVALAESLHYFYVGFNCNAGPTAEPKVRKAIDYLVDVDELVEHFVDPAAQGSGRDRNAAADVAWRQYGPLPDSLAREWQFPVDSWRAVPRRKDLDRAKTLLNEADVGSWQPKILVPEDLLRERFADAIAHELSNAGFRRARTVKVPWSEFRKRLRAGSPSDYHIFVGSWAGWPDPDSFLYPLFHENNEGLTNFTFYQEESVMNRLRRARRTTDRGERRRLYEGAISTLLEDCVHLPAFTLHNTFGVAESLRGFEPHPVASINPRFVGPDGTAPLSE